MKPRGIGYLKTPLWEVTDKMNIQEAASTFETASCMLVNKD